MNDGWFRLAGFFLMFVVAPASWVGMWALVRMVANKYPKKIWR